MATGSTKAFLTMCKNLKDRNFGGTATGQVAEAYVSGYHFTKWMMPQGLSSDYMDKYGYNNSVIIDNIGTNTNAGEVLSACCLAVTPPGGTLNKTEHIGLGGVKWSTPTNIDYGNSLSCKFLEMSGLPIMRIIGGWCKLIRDNKIGTASLNAGAYAKNNYAASVFYWTTKPDGVTVEYAACYSGVFPTKDPQDLFSGDVSSVDKLEMDIDFNVDFVYHEDWVYDKCNTWSMNYSNGVASQYNKDNGGAERPRLAESDYAGSNSAGSIDINTNINATGGANGNVTMAG